MYSVLVVQVSECINCQAVVLKLDLNSCLQHWSQLFNVPYAGSTQPAAEVSYVERIRAMSALFKVGEMATSEVSQAALQAALNSVRDGSIFAANHYADALDIYV